MKRWRGALLVASFALGACGWMPKSAQPEPDLVVVERGALQQVVLLTGVLDAASSVALLTPRTESWNITIRKITADGTEVKEGEAVVEFDNSAVLDRISDLEASAVEADSELATARADHAVKIADARFEVASREIAVAKAELKTHLPAELQSAREHRNATLELSRSQSALSGAQDDLKSTIDGAQLDEKVKALARGKAIRAYEAALVELGQLSLTAPRDGLFTVGVDPFEGRKLQAGDSVWPGTTVGSLPDLNEMIVQAQLSDVDDGRVMPGMAVRCTVDAFADRPLIGTVRGVSPVAHAAQGRSLRRFFAVAIDLDRADPQLLQPGLSVKVEVLGQHVDEAPLVSRAAVDLGEAGATVVVEDGTSRAVQLHFCTPQLCAIAEGLAVGDRVRKAGAR